MTQQKQRLIQLAFKGRQQIIGIDGPGLCAWGRTRVPERTMLHCQHAKRLAQGFEQRAVTLGGITVGVGKQHRRLIAIGLIGAEGRKGLHRTGLEGVGMTPTLRTGDCFWFSAVPCADPSNGDAPGQTRGGSAYQSLENSRLRS